MFLRVNPTAGSREGDIVNVLTHIQKCRQYIEVEEAHLVRVVVAVQYQSHYKYVNIYQGYNSSRQEGENGSACGDCYPRSRYEGKVHPRTRNALGIPSS